MSIRCNFGFHDYQIKKVDQGLFQFLGGQAVIVTSRCRRCGKVNEDVMAGSDGMAEQYRIMMKEQKDD